MLCPELFKKLFRIRWTLYFAHHYFLFYIIAHCSSKVKQGNLDLKFHIISLFLLFSHFSPINSAFYFNLRFRYISIDGYVVKLELPELRNLISLLRRTSNNFNQITRRANSMNRIYDDAIHEMKEMIGALASLTKRAYPGRQKASPS